MFSHNPHNPQFTMEPRSFSSHPEYFPFSPPSFINNQDNTLRGIFSTTPQPCDEHQVLPPATEMAPSPTKNGKRPARNDRHSKIVTAQGPRDRRMRLNLEVAPQFFDIQDMLGYDKASKTVQWLMNEAKSSIDMLKASVRPLAAQSLSTEASSSEFECKSSASQPNIDPTGKKRAGWRPSTRRSTDPSNPLIRESRAMARARARERTREKKINNNLIFSNSIPIESMDEELVSQDLKSSLDLVADQMEEQCSPSTNNGERTGNDLGVSILDYEQWANMFASIEDVQIQTRLW